MGEGIGNNKEPVGSNDIYTREATKVEVIGVTTNLALFIFKLLAGILGKSGAMVSDAIHTASDVFADLIAITGLQLSKKEEDKEHPYGHEKIECIFTVMLGVVLLVVGLSVGRSAVVGIFSYISGNRDSIPQPGVVAVVAAVVSIVSKEVLFQYVIRKSKKLNSPTLKATAWHHRSDSLSSIGAMIGIVGARFGITVLDAVASLIICLIVVKIGIDVLMTSVKNLIDTSADAEDEEKIIEICRSFPGVESVIDLKTRQFGHKIYVEATIGCRNDLDLEGGHAIAEGLHDKLEMEINNIKHVFIHVDPVEFGGKENKIAM
ncbi:cation diffusion facilitator family transporter [Lachnospiraceae bacterium NSJ-143]|nr:cation diffusion facilitator family transporter [Lachnospiraceae bacterium NSJ-143]